MEVLLGGLINKRDKLKNVFANTKSRYYIGIIVLGGVSFLMGRVIILNSFFPCGIALTAAMVSRGRENIYLMPFMVMGTMTYYGSGSYIFGDITATILCGILFFILAKKKLKVEYTGLLAMSVTIVVKAFYLLASPVFVNKDVAFVGVEGIIVFSLVYMFNIFFGAKAKRKEKTGTVAQGVVAMSVVCVLTVGGLEATLPGGVSLVSITGLFITVFIGYKMGILEGALAGIVTGGIATVLITMSPAIIGVYAFAGLTAGFFQGLSRLVTGTVFVAVCIGFGLLNAYQGLYMPILNPLIAGTLFIAIPNAAIDKIEIFFARLRRDEQYYDLVGRESSKKILYEYVESFERMAKLQNSDGENDSMIQMQFKALAKLGKKMIADLDNPVSFFNVRPFKYTMKVGVSSYARENNVCGDSYLCTEYKKGAYMLALSDGMGKGVRAAEESTATISGLFNLMKAGFDIDLALRTMNSILKSKTEDEIFTTVDMCLLDRTSGKMLLYKIGAAATFIKRGSTVEAIKVANLPIGLVNNISVDYIEVQAKKGDKIIFVSDGITEADYEEGGIEWLRQTIETIKSSDPQTISDLIINRAMERYGIREKDDMTVITSLII